MARGEYDAAIAERDQALAQNHRLQHMLHQLQRMQPARRSEKLLRTSCSWRLRISSRPLR